MNEGMD